MGPRGSALLFLDDLVDAGGHIPLCVLFQPADAAVQLGEALGHDIRQILLVQVIGGVDGLVVDAHHLGGHAHGGAVGGQVAQHNAACADAGVIADIHRAQHLGARADQHIVPQGGVAFAGVLAGATFTLHFYPGLALGSMALSAAVIDLATLQACRASLKEKSAALLLPRAPAAGKRILLEYLTPLWKRMSFSQKTTARNLFRYKKRFFMTVLGVAGCTALLLIGFGIQDSLLPMLTKQTTELTHADLTISLSDEKALTMENGLADLLDSSSGITSWGRYYTKSVTLYNAAGEKETVSLVAAADESQMTEYFTFRTRQGHKPIAFDDSSVILTEKTAEKLGLSVGDSFEVETADGGRRSLTLTGITENYVFTRLYLSQAQLKTLNGGALPAWNAVYGQTDCPTDAARASLSSAILACNYVSSVSFIEDTTQMFDGLIGCLNYVVMLVIVCAAALAAVVLYNLISVNLGERKKELATIKVLGFYDKEVYRYIFREIDLLSLIGSLVGLVVGIPLHQFIIRTVEMDQMMFIRSIAPRSFVFSVALTMLFNFAVCLLMRRHVRQISMVESMKAPE